MSGFGIGHPRVILYAAPSDYLLAARVVNRVLADGYEWPSDGCAIVQFEFTDGSKTEFAARRGKSSLTIYGPAVPHAPTTPSTEGQGE